MCLRPWKKRYKLAPALQLCVSKLVSIIGCTVIIYNPVWRIPPKVKEEVVEEPQPIEPIKPLTAREMAELASKTFAMAAEIPPPPPTVIREYWVLSFLFPTPFPCSPILSFLPHSLPFLPSPALPFLSSLPLLSPSFPPFPCSPLLYLPSPALPFISSLPLLSPSLPPFPCSPLHFLPSPALPFSTSPCSPLHFLPSPALPFSTSLPLLYPSLPVPHSVPVGDF